MKDVSDIELDQFLCESPKTEVEESKDVAVIGISGKFSSAENIDEYWKMLYGQKDSLRAFPKNRRRDTDLIKENLSLFTPTDYPIGGYFNSIDEFDYSFFSLSPKEASLMDPNQRVFLEVAWEAIEDAGYGGELIKGSNTGVFVGFSSDSEVNENYQNLIRMVSPEFEDLSTAGNIKSIIASRISYLLDLKGPSMVIDTACSSSLMAINTAVNYLQQKEISMAIAGGVKIGLLPDKGISDIGISSSDGKTRAFDYFSDGTGRGEGCGSVVLKLLDDAIRDKDHIYAIIKGSASNQDGRSNGITAPNPKAQKEVVLSALKKSKVDPETIKYMEAHGTGTKLGDPIEISAISEVYSSFTNKKQFCGVGSVKSNIGHLDHAAGIAGFIKVILSLKNKTILPTINFNLPNEKISFETSPFYVNTKPSFWEENATIPRRAAISSFGLSGTNCHIILEEAPSIIPTNTVNKKYSFLFSAKSMKGLKEVLKRHLTYVKQTDPNLFDLSKSLLLGRAIHDFRCVLIAENQADLQRKLKLLIKADCIQSNDLENDIYVNFEKTQEGIEVISTIELDDNLVKKYLLENEKEIKQSCPNEKYNKLSLPSYPFQKQRCWVDLSKLSHNKGYIIEKEQTDHFLTRYKVTVFKDGTWFVRDHKVNNENVVPGTATIEIIAQLLRAENPNEIIKFSDLVFSAPLVVDEKEKQIHIDLVKDSAGITSIKVYDKSYTYCSVVLEQTEEQIERTSFSEFEKLLTTKAVEPAEVTMNKLVQTGDRWKNVQKVYLNEKTYVAELELPPQFQNEMKDYFVHPAIFDNAVNLLNSAFDEVSYLPLSYRKLNIRKNFSKKIISAITVKNSEIENQEILKLNVAIFDSETKELLAEAKDYTIKKVREENFRKKIPLNKISWHSQDIDWSETNQPQKNNILIVGTQSTMAQYLYKKLEKENNVYILGNENGEKIDNKKAFFYTGKQSEIERMFKSFSSNAVEIDHIIYANILESVENTQKILLQLLRFVKATFRLKYQKQEKINFSVLTENAVAVEDPSIPINPAGNALIGMSKVIAQEFEEFNLSILDVNETTNKDFLLWLLQHQQNNLISVIRNNQYYLPRLVNIPKMAEPLVKLKEKGVYILTGGSGGIGKYLTHSILQKDSTIIWLGRTPAEEVDYEFMGNSLKDKVEYYEVDICDETLLNQVCKTVLVKYKKVDGLFHLAGIPGDGFLALKEEAVFEKVLAPKINGIENLITAFKDNSLDFVILFSSINAVLGGQGQGDYAAANSYLDAIAHNIRCSSPNINHVVSINWPAWMDTGMAEGNEFIEQSGLQPNPIKPGEAIDLLNEIFYSNDGNIIVGDFSIEIAEKHIKNIDIEKESKHYLTGRKSGRYSDTEIVLAKIWYQLLGIEQINVNSDFYKMGGDSIFAFKIVNAIKSELKCQISITDIFELLTIEKIALFLDRNQPFTSDKKTRQKNEQNTLTQVSPNQFKRIIEGQLDKPENNVLAVKKILNKTFPDEIRSKIFAVIETNDFLLSSIEEIEDNYYWVHSDQPMEYTVKDFSDLTPNALAESVERFIISLREYNFSISKGPLLKTYLIKCSEKEKYLILLAHSLIIDENSARLLLDEFLDVNKKAVAYVNALEITPKNNKDKIAFWREQVEKNTELIFFPSISKRPDRFNNYGKNYQFQIHKNIFKLLRSNTTKYDVDIRSNLMAAFRLFIHYLDDKEQVNFGFTTEKNTEKQFIGVTRNKLFINSNLKSCSSFIETIHQTAQLVSEAEANELDFAEITKLFNNTRFEKYPTLFQVMFDYYLKQENSDWTLETNPIEAQMLLTDRYVETDLQISCIESEKGIQCVFKYNTEAISTETIKLFTESFEFLLKKLNENPEAAIDAVNFESFDQLSIIENCTQDNERRDFCENVTNIALKTPNQIAFRTATEQYSFEYLNTKSNQLAHYLLDITGTKNPCIGIFTGRSVETVIIMLATLKINGSYLFLDSMYPDQRLAYVLADSQPEVILSNSELINKIRQVAKTPLYNYEDIELESYSIESPNCPIDFQSNAYHIYTSGSTGNPKRVTMSRNNMSYVLDTTWDQFLNKQKAQKRVAISASFCFDASMIVFSSLAFGHSIELIPDPVRRDIFKLATYLNEQKVQIVDVVPSTLKLLFREGLFNHDNSCIETVIVGGEKIEQSLWEEIGETEHVNFYNSYGPTECSSQCTSCKIDAFNALTTIGKPLPNVKLAVVDSNNHPVPLGFVGDLVVSGKGVSKGYKTNPELTEQLFVMLTIQGERSLYYKTGDYVRLLQDGNIEYIGRKDQLVKVRGYNVNYSEIISCIKKIEGVNDVAITYDDKLVAYLKLDNIEISRADLINEISLQLPDYMIPNQFVSVEEIPLTDNNKIDYKRLKKTTNDLILEEKYAAPSTAYEKSLADIWSHLIKHDRISIFSNFFGLGGHSLQATQVLSRIRSEFNIEITLSEFFEHPELEKLALLIKRKVEQNQTVAEFPFQSIERSERLDLSHAQKRIWFMELLAPNTSIYNIPSARPIYGKLDIDCMKESLQELVQRHEAFRTNFKMDDEQIPYQSIKEKVILAIDYLDFSDFDEKLAIEKVKAICEKDSKKSFNLMQDQLVRFKIFKVGAAHFVLYMCMHHIISDGWSEGIILNELKELYKSKLEHSGLKLPDLKYHYVDYAYWQNELLKTDILDKQERYWMEQLSGEIPTLELPTDFSRNNLTSDRGSSQKRFISKELIENLEEYSSKEGITLFMILFAAFNLLLSKYSGETDIVVGSPIANRSRVETENIIGFFVNTIALRTSINPEQTVRSYLMDVKKVTLEAYDNQDIPFEKIVEVLQPERVLNQNPIFQVMFSHQNAPKADFVIEELNSKSLSLSDISVDRGTSMFDFSLDLVGKFGGIEVSAEYKTDLFKSESINRLLGHYESILNNFIDNLNNKIKDFNFLLSDELALLETNFGNKQEVLDMPADFVEYFEKQVVISPDKVAVEMNHIGITYQEMKIKIEKYTEILKKCHLNEQAAIAVMLDRSPEMIILIIAIWKAGYVYVPIDPLLPIHRVSYILDKSNTELLITDSKEKELEATENYLVLELTELLAISKKAVGIKSHQTIEANDLAYIIFTSGTTGKPKGVMIEHKGMMNHMWAKIHDLVIDKQDIIAQTASQAFDISIWQFFAGLLVGAKVIIYENDTAQDAIQLATDMIEDQITICELVPPMAAVLLDVRKTKSLYSDKLRYLILTGESTPIKLVNDWLAFNKNLIIINAYGPTEASDDITHYMVKQKVTGERLPIGKPIRNMAIKIISPVGGLCPIGVYGEIIVSGIGVGRGYVNDLEKTKASFGEMDGVTERYYKTGDIGRWLLSGDIDFIGRKDSQIKINGYRIEIEEIRTVLLETTGIKNAVVVYDKAQGLLAYIVIDKFYNEAAAQKRLQDYLPHYMVPNNLFQIAKIPTNINGKVDIPNLLQWSKENRVNNKQEISQVESSPLEKELINIWQRVLDRSDFTVTDNFFDIGGHSLLITKLILEVQKDVKSILKVKDVFMFPTVRKMATFIEKNNLSDESYFKEKITKNKSKQFYDLSPAQLSLFLEFLSNPESTAYNTTMFFEVKHEIDIQRLEYALKRLIDRHESLRTRFDFVQGKPVQIISNSSDYCLEFSEIPKNGTSAEFQNFIRPFNLYKDHLIRMKAIKILDENTSYILIDLHHIVTDGMSNKLLIDEFVHFYEKSEPLYTKGARYVDYVAWQKDFLNSSEGNHQKNYWLNEFKTGVPKLHVEDHNNKLERANSQIRLDFSLNKAVINGIRKQFKKNNEITIMMILLAMVVESLKEIDQHEDVVIGIPVIGRNHLEVQHTIGMFINILPVKFQYENDCNFSDVLDNINRKVLLAYDNQEYPYEKLIEELGIKSTINRNPLFNITFNYQLSSETDMKEDSFFMKDSFTEEGPKFDLSFEVLELEENIKFSIFANEDVYSHSDLDKLSEQINKSISILEVEDDYKITNKSNEDFEMLFDFSE